MGKVPTGQTPFVWELHGWAQTRSRLWLEPWRSSDMQTLGLLCTRLSLRVTHMSLRWRF